MITEEMLTAAALELSDTMNKYMPSPEDCVHTFSLRFHRKMRKVIRKAEHPVLYQFARKAAAIVLIIFLGFVTLIAVSPSVRADVVGWIKEKYETFYEYYFIDENFISWHEYTYCIDPIPEGYILISSTCNEGHGKFIYSDNSEYIVRFTYCSDLSATKLFNETQEMTIKNSKIGLENTDIEVYYSSVNNGDCSIVAYLKEEKTICQISGKAEIATLLEFLKNFKINNK